MELRHLRSFVAVVRHGTFTRAAEELYLTQSALSQHVRRLERELGVALLQRTSRGAELTAAGEALLPAAEAMLAEEARARAVLDLHAGVARGRARVAATAVDAPQLPAALAELHRTHPRLQIALRHVPAADVPALVAGGSADIGVAALSGPPPAGVELIALAEQELRALLAPEEGDGTGEVALDDLRGRPFVLAERGTALRETTMAICQAAGFSPVPLFEVSDPATARYLVHAGLGVTIAPAAWLDVPGPAVASARITGITRRHRVSLVVPAGGETPTGRLLRDLLVQHGV